MTRVVTQEDRKDVENAFLEVFKELSSGSNSFGLFKKILKFNVDLITDT